MASPNTLKLRAIRPRRTLLGPYIQVTEKDNEATKYVRDHAHTTFKSRDGTTYTLKPSGAIELFFMRRNRGVKPHPRGGGGRLKFSR